MLTELGIASALGLGTSYLAYRFGLMGGKHRLESSFIGNEFNVDVIDKDNVTVRTKSKEMFRIFQINGLNYDGISGEEDGRLAEIRSNFFKDIGFLGVDLRIFGIKRPVDLSYEAKWPTKALRLIGDAENRYFSKSSSIKWYIIASSKSLAKLGKAEKYILSKLSNFDPVLLESSDRDCKITSFLNYLFCGEFLPKNIRISRNISANIQGAELQFNRDGIMQAYIPEKQYQQIISVRLFEGQIRGDLTQKILSIQGDIEINQTVISGKQDSKRLLHERERKATISMRGDMQQAQEHGEIAQKISSRKGAIFKTQTVVIARSNSPENLKSLINEISNILSDNRIQYHVETIGAPYGWFARVPGNNFLLANLNIMDGPIAAIWPFHNASIGQKTGIYGDKPVCLLNTVSGAGYSVQFGLPGSREERPLSNYMIVAPSGGGKSTLITHLLRGLAKWEKTPSFLLDSKEGAKFMVNAFGGYYMDYEQLQLNPLDVGEDNRKNRQKLYSFMRTLLQLDPDDLSNDRELSHFLDVAFALSTPERTLNNLTEVSFSQDSRLRHKLMNWITDQEQNQGIYSHIFNAPKDSLKDVLSQSHMIGINMNEALEDDVLGPPVVKHVVSAIESLASQVNGFNLFIDEAANLLRNKEFRQSAEVMYREYRKMGGAVGMAFQDPKALMNSGIASSIIENTALQIFLPNRKADAEALTAMGLDSNQIDFIKTPVGKNADGSKKRHALFVKEDGATGYLETAVVDVGLEILGEDIMKFYRAGTDANNKMEHLKSKHGDNWTDFL